VESTKKHTGPDDVNWDTQEKRILSKKKLYIKPRERSSELLAWLLTMSKQRKGLKALHKSCEFLILRGTKKYIEQEFGGTRHSSRQKGRKVVRGIRRDCEVNN